MGDLQRRSPVQFDVRPLKTETRDCRLIVAQYEDEGRGPWLVDLSHKARWDLQHSRIDDMSPMGVSVPPVPGDCRLGKDFLVNRMNRIQAAIWHLGDDPAPEMPGEMGYTDVSEASVFIALFGRHVFSIAEKLTAMDLAAPDRQPPTLFQGPFSHVPCQIVLLKRNANGVGMLLLTCSRGYAQDMVNAVLSAGAPHGLRPAGEERFVSGLSDLMA